MAEAAGIPFVNGNGSKRKFSVVCQSGSGKHLKGALHTGGLLLMTLMEPARYRHKVMIKLVIIKMIQF